MEYEQITSEDYSLFHRLLEDYYRDGEDAQTSQQELDDFIQMLFGMILEQTIHGGFVKKDALPAGFVLWALDTPALPFSEIPGAGTILEIGVLPEFRRSGLGSQIVLYVEKQLISLGISQCYVSAYGPAQEFWGKSGYAFYGATASNGLPIMVKQLIHSAD